MASTDNEEFPMDAKFIEQLVRLEQKVERLLKLVNSLYELVKSTNVTELEEFLGANNPKPK